MEVLFAQLVPIVAIVMGIGMAGWSVYWDHQRKRLQYEERRLMIEKGMTPPPLPPDPPRRTLESSLRNGIILVFLGIGLGIAGLLAQPNGLSRILAVAASIVLLLGLGNLAYYTVAKGQARSSPSSEG